MTWEASSIPSSPKHTKILGQKSPPQKSTESALPLPSSLPTKATSHSFPQEALLRGGATIERQRHLEAEPFITILSLQTAAEGKGLHHWREPTYPTRRGSRRARGRPGVEKPIRARAKDTPSPTDHTNGLGQGRAEGCGQAEKAQRRSQLLGGTGWRGVLRPSRGSSFVSRSPEQDSVPLGHPGATGLTRPHLHLLHPPSQPASLPSRGSRTTQPGTSTDFPQHPSNLLPSHLDCA